MRSPIEMMVDRACGVTPADLAKPDPISEAGNLLLEIADEAVRWTDAGEKPSQRFLAAVAEWKKFSPPIK